MSQSKPHQLPNDRELLATTNQALEAFWETVALRFPEAQSGDLSPLTTVRLSIVAKDAIAEWVANNLPTTVGTGD